MSIATQLNSTSSGVELRRRVAIDTSPAQLNYRRRSAMQLTQLQRTANQRETGQSSWVELCRHKRAFTLARQTVYAMARNFACQWGKNSQQCAWGCGSGEVVRAMSWNVQQLLSKILRLVTAKLSSARAWRWMSRISWTVRDLRATDATTWRKLCVTLSSWPTSSY